MIQFMLSAFAVTNHMWEKKILVLISASTQITNTHIGLKKSGISAS